MRRFSSFDFEDLYSRPEMWKLQSEADIQSTHQMKTVESCEIDVSDFYMNVPMQSLNQPHHIECYSFKYHICWFRKEGISMIFWLFYSIIIYRNFKTTRRHSTYDPALEWFQTNFSQNKNEY